MATRQRTYDEYAEEEKAYYDSLSTQAEKDAYAATLLIVIPPPIGEIQEGQVREGHRLYWKYVADGVKVWATDKNPSGEFEDEEAAIADAEQVTAADVKQKLMNQGGFSNAQATALVKLAKHVYKRTLATLSKEIVDEFT